MREGRGDLRREGEVGDREDGETDRERDRDRHNIGKESGASEGGRWEVVMSVGGRE